MKDSYWFRHDVNARRDEKIIDLIADLGYEGYGIFWGLVEYLRECPHYETEYKSKRLSIALGADESLIEQVINGYGLFHRDENGKFYSNSLKARMKEMDLKREQQRQKALKRWKTSDEKESETNQESRGNAVALPPHSHKNTVEDTTLENSIVKKNTPDERVQGEKGEKSFFAQCLDIRNDFPVTLFFEYTHFTGNSKLSTAEENRSNFIGYWKNSLSQKSSNYVWLRLASMARTGFNLSKEKTKEQLGHFEKNLEKEKTEVEFYTDFLEQLKREGFKPVEGLKVLAGNYLKF